MLWRTQELYPNDIRKQLDFSRQKPASYRMLGIISLTQQYVSCNDDKIVELRSSTLELLFRNLLDLTDHLQDTLPDGVYDDNSHRLNPSIQNIIKQIDD